MEATHEISACYFPKKGEAELTWESFYSGEKVSLTVKVSHEEGMQLAEVVPACVYVGAVVKGNHDKK